MPRGNFLRRRQLGARRPMDWECGDVNATLASGDKLCNWLILPSDIRTGYTDPTLMATMVWLQASRTSAAAETAPIFGFGVIVVSAFDDADPTAAACPGPITDCDADWAYLYYWPHVTSAAGNFVDRPPTELDRRSQARRRLGNDKAILLVGEALNGGFSFHAHVRALIKE